MPLFDVKSKDPNRRPNGEYQWSGPLKLVVMGATEEKGVGSGSRRWLVYYWRKLPAPAKAKKQKYWIGSIDKVDENEALEKTVWVRRHADAGRCPREERDRELAANQMTNAPTFLAHATAMINDWFPAGSANRGRWQGSINLHAKPIHHMRLNAIRPADIIGLLLPIWTQTPAAAQDARARIERIIGSAIGIYLPDNHLNPAALTRPLIQRLGQPAQRGEIKGAHASMDPADVPAFMVELAARPETQARMLECVILTCLRSQELRLWKKSWLALDAAKVVIPRDVMKVHRTLDHDVPLTPRVVEILRERIAELDTIFGADADYHIWAGSTLTQPINEDAMRTFLREKMQRDLTVHGFRATFRDWADDVLLPEGVNDDAIEVCLAHVAGTKVKRAYRRGSLFAARVPIMQRWASACLPPPAATTNVTPIRRVA